MNKKCGISLLLVMSMLLMLLCGCMAQNMDIEINSDGSGNLSTGMYFSSQFYTNVASTPQVLFAEEIAAGAKLSTKTINGETYTGVVDNVAFKSLGELAYLLADVSGLNDELLMVFCEFAVNDFYQDGRKVVEISGFVADDNAIKSGASDFGKLTLIGEDSDVQCQNVLTIVMDITFPGEIISVKGLKDNAYQVSGNSIHLQVQSGEEEQFYYITGVMNGAADAGAGPSADPVPEISAAPEIPVSGMSYARNQTITVDGKAVEFQTYALKDGRGYETNYVKVRDLAYTLNGTAAQFQVGWNGDAHAIELASKTAYTENGSEMTTPFSGDRAYTLSAAATYVDGIVADLSAITLTDDMGGGYTYYKLRDLGQALGFEVDWSAEIGIIVNTK